MMLPENDRAVEKLERSGDHAKLNLRQREGCWGGWGWDAQKDLSSKGMKLARKGKEEEREIGLFCCRIVPTVGWKCKGRANEFDWFAMCHANWGEGVGKHGKWNGVGMMWNKRVGDWAKRETGNFWKQHKKGRLLGTGEGLVAKGRDFECGCDWVCHLWRRKIANFLWGHVECCVLRA